MALRVLRPSSNAHHLVSSVRSITPTILKVISPYCINIYVMYVGYAQTNIVAPPIILNFLLG